MMKLSERMQELKDEDCPWTLTIGLVLIWADEVVKLESKNVALRAKARKEMFRAIAAECDLNKPPTERKYCEGCALLTEDDTEKRFAQSLSKRTTPLSDEEKRSALTPEDTPISDIPASP